jgi:negative regulator of flagellin synthesis FlgM
MSEACRKTDSPITKAIIMVDPTSFGPLRPVEHRKTAAAPPLATVESKAAIASLAVAQTTSKFSLSTLTAMARELSDAGPPVDHARIAQIRQAIAQGSYRIDPNAIADAVLRHYDSDKP